MAEFVDQCARRARPLSPHLTIYKPQLTSVLSIMHRLSGVFLYIGLVVCIWAGVLSIHCPCSCMSLRLWVQHPLGLLFLFGLTAALFYHLLNGVRHLCWDVGTGFSLPAVYRSGYMVLIGTGLCLLATWGSVWWC